VFTDIDYVIDIGAHVGAITILSTLMGKKAEKLITTNLTDSLWYFLPRENLFIRFIFHGKNFV
jgi:hypothetical protein